MAYNSKKDTFLYCSGYNLGPYMDQIGAKMTSEVDSWRPCGTTFPTRTLTGEHAAEITLAGLYESASTALVGAAPDGTDRVWVAGFETDAVSKRFWGLRAAQVSESELVIADGAMDRIQPVLMANGAANIGYVVAPLVPRTTAGNTQATNADMEASAGAGVARAFLIVTALDLDGYDSVTITPQSCDTAGGIYADETAFTTVTAVGGQTVALATAVDRYLAVKWAYVGSGTSPSVTFWVGVSRD
jgi:hypothetical protein